MAYEFVTDRTLDGSSSLAMDPAGDTIYLAIRGNTGGSTGTIVSLDWPNLDNESVVYSDPAGYDLCGVACTADGPKALVAAHADGTVQLRSLDDTVLWTSPVIGISTTGGGAVWNPTNSRLYVGLRPSGGSAFNLYSMDEDGTSVTTEITGTAQPVNLPPHLTVTDDGAVWWNSGNPRRWTSADGEDTGGFGSTPDSDLAVDADDPTDVLYSVNTGTSGSQIWVTRQVEWDGSAVQSASPNPTIFDGWRVVHGAVNADFTRGVALGMSPSPSSLRFWRFGDVTATGNWSVGRVRWPR